MNLHHQQWTLQLAYNVALASKDPSTQNGAVIVNESYIPICFGYNAFPNGVRDTEERWERPLKYSVIEHAERNVIYKAACNGVHLHNKIMVCPWAACSDCARGIIQVGIKELITHKQAHDRSPSHWVESIGIAMEMLSEAGVTVTFFDGKVFDEEEEESNFNILHSGELWNP